MKVDWICKNVTECNVITYLNVPCFLNAGSDFVPAIASKVTIIASVYN